MSDQKAAGRGQRAAGRKRKAGKAKEQVAAGRRQLAEGDWRGEMVFGRYVLYAVVMLVGAVTTGGEAAQTAPMLAGCPVFPVNNVWNTPVDHLAVDSNSAAYVATIGSTVGVHPDFGAALWDGGPIGIPYTVVPGNQPRVGVSFEYDDESDPGPYPIPPDAAIEGGSNSSGDRHVLVLDRQRCVLYETFASYPQPDGTWEAGSGAIFDLYSHELRPSGWTSADAAGLPILPGLVRYDEVAAGEIRHALRFTAPQTQKKFVWPARHYASSLTSTNYPPMGKRFRLKAGFDVSTFSADVQVILRALKKYGMILADNGSAWYISGAPDPRWNDDVLVSELRRVKGADFEAVDETPLIVDVNSGQARQLSTGPPGSAAMAVGVYRNGSWYLDRNRNGVWDGCGTDVCSQIGLPSDAPLVGDWSGSGTSRVGVFRPSSGTFYLDYNGNGIWDGCSTDRCVAIGQAGDVPLVGDWTGTGTSKVGVFRPGDGVFYLDANGNGAWDGCAIDACMAIGQAGDAPLVGDWSGSGSGKVGVFRASSGTFYLDLNGNGVWEGCETDRCATIGMSGDIALVGDWNGNGATKVGLFRPTDGAFYLDYNGNGTWDGCGVDKCLNIGMNGDVPLVGDWDGTGSSKVGVFRPSDGTFYLDYNGSGTGEGCGSDLCLSIGLSGDTPLVGKW